MESCGSYVKKKKTKQNKENKTNDPNYTKPKHKGSTHKLTPRYGQYLSQVLSLFIQVHLQFSLFRFFSHVNALQSDKKWLHGPQQTDHFIIHQVLLQKRRLIGFQR